MTSNRLSFIPKIILPFALILFSCSQRYHCKKCVSGGNLIHDTITIAKNLPVPGVEANKTFQNQPIDWDSLRNAQPDMFPQSPPCPELPPVMELKKGKASAVIKQTNEGLDVKVICAPDTVRVEIEVPVPVEVRVGLSWFVVVLLVVGALIAGGLLVKLFR